MSIVKETNEQEPVNPEEQTEKAGLGELTEDEEPFSYYYETKILTETMADLYMSQRLYQEAIEVYEKLIECDNANQTLLTKLERAKAYMLSKRAGFSTKW